MAEGVSLQYTLEKEYVPLSGVELTHALLEIMPTESAPATQMPLNFSLVLDRSGSMSGKPIKDLKEAVGYVIENIMGPSDFISVTIFNENAKVIVPSQPVSDKDMLIREIDRIKAGGGTHMSKGMILGIEELTKNMEEGRASRLLVLTDGQTFDDEDICKEQAQECVRMNVPVTSLGLGKEWNEDLLYAIGDESGSGCRTKFVTSPDQFQDVFEGIVEKMKGAVVNNTKLRLIPVAGVTVDTVYGVIPDPKQLTQSPLQRGVEVYLGEIVKDEGQIVLVEMSLPDRKAGKCRIAQVEVAYDLPLANKTGEKVTTDVIVNYTSDPQLTKKKNTKVLEFLERIRPWRALNEAKRLIKEGRKDEAIVLLQEAGETVRPINPDLAQKYEDYAKMVQQGAGAEDISKITRIITQEQKDTIILTLPTKVLDPGTAQLDPGTAQLDPGTDGTEKLDPGTEKLDESES